uniref:Ribosomal protein L21 n=1 Tax=Phaeophyceae sp. TaxID=2249243 RepID=A0A8E5BG87_9PHAE|nr:ribosomal protein L21 [Phaeophyceae sp.]
MKYAILEASGRQFWVEPTKFFELNRLSRKVGSTLIFKRVLFLNKKGVCLIGQPYLMNQVVKGIITKHFLGIKILIFKMKPKKKYRKKLGHRQKLTRVLINIIE